MKAVCVFVDGILCDTRPRQPLTGTPDFYKRELVAKDPAVPGSVRCMQELAQRYQLVYIGARPDAAQAVTGEWLQATGFPKGPVYVAKTQAERLALVKDLKDKFDFVAGIGTRWNDNELHLEIGCLSIILKEFEVNWDTVRKHLLGKEHTALQTAVTLLAPWATASTTPAPHRLDVMLEARDLLLAVAALHTAHWGYLSAITGLDHPSTATDATPDAAPGEFEVLYHFCEGAAIVTLRLRVSRIDPAIPSICSTVPSATFFERELSEMFGLTITGTPNPDRLFLPDDWPNGFYPLRKDFIMPAATAQEQCLPRRGRRLKQQGT